MSEGSTTQQQHISISGIWAIAIVVTFGEEYCVLGPIWFELRVWNVRASGA